MNNTVLETCAQLVAELKSIDANFFFKQHQRKSAATTSTTTPRNSGSIAPPPQQQQHQSKKSWKILGLKPATTTTTKQESVKLHESSSSSSNAGSLGSAFSPVDLKQQEILERILNLRRWFHTLLHNRDDVVEYKQQITASFKLVVQCARQQIEQQAQYERSSKAKQANAAATGTAAAAPKSSTKRFNHLLARKFSAKSTSTASTTATNEEEGGEGENDDAEGGGGEEESEAMENEHWSAVEDPTLALTLLADMCGIQTCLALIDSKCFEEMVALCNEEMRPAPAAAPQHPRTILRQAAAVRCLSNLSKRASFLAALCEPVRLQNPQQSNTSTGADVVQLPKHAHTFHFGLDSSRFPTTLRVLCTLSAALSANKASPPNEDFLALLTRVLDTVFDFGAEQSFDFLLEKKEQDEFVFHVKQICEAIWKLVARGGGARNSTYATCLAHAITVWAAISQRSADALAMRKAFVDKYLVPNLAQSEALAVGTHLLEFEAKQNDVYPEDDLVWREQTMKRLLPALLYHHGNSNSNGKLPGCFAQWLVCAIKIQPDYVCADWIPDHLFDGTHLVTLGLTAIHDGLLGQGNCTALKTSGKALAAKLLKFIDGSSTAPASETKEEEDEVLGRLRFPQTLMFAPEEMDVKHALLIIPLLPVLLGRRDETVAQFALHSNAAISYCALNVMNKPNMVDEQVVVNVLDQADVDSVRTNALISLLKLKLDGMADKSILAQARGSLLYHALAVARRREELENEVEVIAHARALARARMRPLMRILIKPSGARMTPRLNREVFGAMNVLCATANELEFVSVFGDLWTKEVLAVLPNWVVNRAAHALTRFLAKDCEPIASRLLLAPPVSQPVSSWLKFICLLDAILCNSAESGELSDSACSHLGLFFDNVSALKQQGGVEVHSSFLRLVDVFVRHMRPSTAQQVQVFEMIRDSPFKSNSVRICILRSLAAEQSSFPPDRMLELEEEICKEMEVNKDVAVQALGSLFAQRAALDVGLHYAVRALEHDVYLLALLSWYEKQEKSNSGGISSHLSALLLLSIWLCGNKQKRTEFLRRLFPSCKSPNLESGNELVCAEAVARSATAFNAVDLLQQAGNLLAIAPHQVLREDESQQISLCNLLLASADAMMIGEYEDTARLFNVLWKVSTHVKLAVQRDLLLRLWRTAVRRVTDHSELFQIFFNISAEEREVEVLAMEIWSFIAPDVRVRNIVVDSDQILGGATTVSLFQAKLMVVTAGEMRAGCEESDEVFGFLLHAACYERGILPILASWKLPRGETAVADVASALENAAFLLSKARATAIEFALKRLERVDCEASVLFALHMSAGSGQVLLEAVRVAERLLRQRASSTLLNKLLREFPPLLAQNDQKGGEFFSKLVGVCLQFAETQRAAYEQIDRAHDMSRLQQGFAMLDVQAPETSALRFIAFANSTSSEGSGLSLQEVYRVGKKVAMHKSILRALHLCTIIGGGLNGDEGEDLERAVTFPDPIFLETCACLLANHWGAQVKSRVYDVLGKIPDLHGLGETMILCRLLGLAMEDFLHGGVEEAKPFLLHGQGLLASAGEAYQPFTNEDVSKALFGWSLDEPKPVRAATTEATAEHTWKAVPGFVSLEELAQMPRDAQPEPPVAEKEKVLVVVAPVKVEEEVEPVEVEKQVKPVQVVEAVEPVKEVAKPVQVEETAKPVQVEAAKPVQVEGAKPVQVEAAKPVQVEAAKPVQVEAAKPVQVEAAKPAQVEESKPAQVEQVKPPVQVEDSKPVQAGEVMRMTKTEEEVREPGETIQLPSAEQRRKALSKLAKEEEESRPREASEMDSRRKVPGPPTAVPAPSPPPPAAATTAPIKRNKLAPPPPSSSSTRRLTVVGDAPKISALFSSVTPSPRNNNSVALDHNPHLLRPTIPTGRRRKPTMNPTLFTDGGGSKENSRIEDEDYAVV